MGMNKLTSKSTKRREMRKTEALHRGQVEPHDEYAWRLGLTGTNGRTFGLVFVITGSLSMFHDSGNQAPSVPERRMLA